MSGLHFNEKYWGKLRYIFVDFSNPTSKPGGEGSVDASAAAIAVDASAAAIAASGAASENWSTYWQSSGTPHAVAQGA